MTVGQSMTIVSSVDVSSSINGNDADVCDGDVNSSDVHTHHDRLSRVEDFNWWVAFKILRAMGRS